MAANDGDGTIRTADTGSDQAPGTVHDSAGQFSGSSDTKLSQEEKDLVQEVRDNFAFAWAYDEAQRKAENEQDEFEADDMWTSDARDARAEYVDEETGRKIPARPAIEVNLIEQHVQQVVSEARQARLSLSVKPKAGIANTKTSDYFKGLMRSIQAESGAGEIRIWSLERTARLGRGAYYIDADFANDGDFDLDVQVKRLLDQSTVFLDPYAQAANCVEDAEWGMITDLMAKKERLRRWKDKPMIPQEGIFTDEKDLWFPGVAGNDDNQQVRVAMYYKVVRTPRVLAFHPEVGNQWLDEMPARARQDVEDKRPETKTREVFTRSVKMVVCDGQQVLEESNWTGTLIPIIRTVGKEYFIKGKHRWKGAIANTMDILRAINVVLSSAVEIAGSSPRSPYIMFEGQDEGHEEMWDDAGTKNFTRLYVRQLEIAGKAAPFPQRQQTEPQIQGLILLLRVLQDFFHAITGSVAPQLRAVNPYDRSGKAIEALQRQGAAGTSNYLDNLATISMTYEGKVLIDAIAKCYDTPGRIVQVSGEEDDDESAIMIKRPFIRGEGGIPEAVPCPACQGKKVIEQTGLSRLNIFAKPQTCPECEGSGFATEENMPEEWQEQTVEYVDFSKGQYKVVPVLDRSFKNTQEEALAGMEALAKAWPEGVPAYAARWVRAMAFSGSNVVADAIESMFPTADADFKNEKVPARFRAQYTQLKQEHDKAMQALQEASKIIETDQIKAMGQKEIATIREAFAFRREALKSQGKMLELQAGASHDTDLETLRGKIEFMLQQSEQRHEVILQLLKEKGEKEVERHSVALHDIAAEEAARRLEDSTVRQEQRDDVRTVHAETREEGRTRGAESREDTRTAVSERRDEGRAVRSEARAETREEAAFRREQEAAKADEKKEE